MLLSPSQIHYKDYWEKRKLLYSSSNSLPVAVMVVMAVVAVIVVEIYMKVEVVLLVVET